MPAADDGEWSNWSSNVVCVRTKSSKDSENNEVPVVSVQPIIVKSVYRNEPSQPSRIVQRRLIQTQPLASPTPVHYEGVSKVSFNLKAPVTAPVINGPSFNLPPFSPSRRSIAVKKSIEPNLSLILPNVSLSLTSGRDFRPVSLASSNRSSSLPPLVSTPYVRRSSVAVPGYLASSGYAGRSFGNTGIATSALRRGSVDVSYLSSVPDSYKSVSYTRPSIGLPSGIRNTYRRSSLSVLGADRPVYRSSTAGRLIEDEFKSVPSDTFSSLRSLTQTARDKLDIHRSLIDKYLPGGGSRAPSVDSHFSYKTDRNADLESFSRRPSLSTAAPRTTATGSRASSIDRSELASIPRPAQLPSEVTPSMSAARRRIRDVLYKVSGDQEYLK